MPVQKGFTLIELVSVVVLLGILALVALPRFLSRDGFADVALRDQLISSFRYAQQQAMYDQSGTCYRLRIDGNGFAAEQGVTSIGPIGEITFTDDYAGLSIAPSQSLYFDGLGNTFTTDCGDTPVADPLILSVGTTGVSIYSTGYIRAN